MNAPQPKPGILSIGPYVGGRAEGLGGAPAVKLSSNESALGPSPKAMAAYKALAGELHLYSDGEATALRATIGAHYGIDPDRIVCGDGSDEILHLACQAYAGLGDEVVSSEQGFLVYPIAARTVGATPVLAPERDWRCNVDALLDAVTAKTRILFIANPNNPTGSYLGADEMRRLHAGLPGDVLMVVDAAYAEYVEQADYEPGIELVERSDNVLMTRTFSKIYGLAGLRLGWAYGSPAMIDAFNRIRGPFNTSSAAQMAGIAALGDVEFTNSVREHTDHWRAWLSEKLTALGLKVGPSVTNFLLIQFASADAARAADDFLTAKGYLLRGMKPYRLLDCLRLTVGREADNRGVVEALSEFLGAQ